MMVVMTVTVASVAPGLLCTGSHCGQGRDSTTKGKSGPIV